MWIDAMVSKYLRSLHNINIWSHALISCEDKWILSHGPRAGSMYNQYKQKESIKKCIQTIPAIHNIAVPPLPLGWVGGSIYLSVGL